VREPAVHEEAVREQAAPAPERRVIPWRIVDLGAAPYREVWAQQLALVEQRQRGEVPDTLLLVEHPHVFVTALPSSDPDVPAAR
jgi:lipoate-protein ligase B